MSAQRGRAPVRLPETRKAATAFLLWAVVSTSACSKRYAEVEVRDPGRVGVAMMGPNGVQPLLAPDGSERVVPLPYLPNAVAARRGREVVIAYEGREALPVVDASNMLPRQSVDSGFEVRGRTLTATYGLTPTRILPERNARDQSPLFLTTDLDNVRDAREVAELRRWPAYVALPFGILFAVAGMSVLVSDGDSNHKTEGALYLGLSAPLLGYSIYVLTAPGEAKPLSIPGLPAR